MQEQARLKQALDLPLLLMYFALVILGWFNIYAAVYDPELDQSIFDLGLNSGKQLLWIAVCLLLVIPTILIIDLKVYSALSFVGYGLSIILLVLVMLLARNINGAQSWLEFGSFRLQPSEFAKVATALALARFLDFPGIKVEQVKYHFIAFGILAVPAILVVLQGDSGSALVFGAFGLVLFREGLPAIYVILALVVTFFFVLTLFFLDNIFLLAGYTAGFALLLTIGALVYYQRKKDRIRTLIGIGLGLAMAVTVEFGINFILSDVLEPHQTKRIEILINPEVDPKGVGYQVIRSKIAIGSGGFWGKGFTEGTQTKFDFVPEQSTDFIFCTVGEEHGWVGSMVVIGLFGAFIYRIIVVAERQKWRFARVYGYSVACILFFHFMINIGMTLGLFPVIGIPLPFFSYGGSSLFAFTILLFILVKLDSHRMQLMARES